MVRDQLERIHRVQPDQPVLKELVARQVKAVVDLEEQEALVVVAQEVPAEALVVLVVLVVLVALVVPAAEVAEEALAALAQETLDTPAAVATLAKISGTIKVNH
jgi:hypothetical protein